MANHQEHNHDQLLPNENLLTEDVDAEYVEQTVLGRLVQGSDWEAVLARLATRQGRYEAKLPSRGGGFLCHDEDFLSSAPEHCICALGNAYPSGWSTSRLRTINDPDASDTAVQAKEYPLHVAASIFDPEDPLLVKHVYEFAPSCISKMNDIGELPLHIACENGNEAAVSFLLQKYKPAVFVKAGDLLPLHYACMTGSCISLILGAYPEAAAIRTSIGNFPLHLAMSYGLQDDPNPLSSLCPLIHAYPRAVDHADSNNWHPLRLAAKKFNYSPSVILHLISDLGNTQVGTIQDACYELLWSLNSKSSPESFNSLLNQSWNAESFFPGSVASIKDNCWAAFRGYKNKNLLFHEWLKNAHKLFTPGATTDSTLPSSSIIKLNTQQKILCERWEGLVHQILVGPNPKCTKMSSFHGKGYPLALMATESYFVFKRTFRQLVQSDGSKLFQPYYTETYFDDGDNQMERIVEVTPIARMLCRIAETYQPFDPKDPTYDVIIQLQEACLQLRRRKSSLFSGAEKQVMPKKTLTKKVEKERKEGCFLPVAHMVCYFAAALHPEDYKTVLLRFLCPGISFGYSPYFDYRANCILTEQDSEGNTPLHYLCGAFVSPLLNDNIKLQQVQRTKRRASRNNKSSHLDAFMEVLSTDDYGNEKRDLLKVIRSRNNRGELPLHLTLKRCSGWQQKHSFTKNLVKLFPESAWTADTNYMGLYPFMLAAIKESRPSITCTYELLKLYVAGRDLKFNPPVRSSNGVDASNFSSVSTLKRGLSLQSKRYNLRSQVQNRRSNKRRRR